MLFENPVRTSKRTPHFTVTEINWLTLFTFNIKPHFLRLLVFTDRGHSVLVDILLALFIYIMTLFSSSHGKMSANNEMKSWWKGDALAICNAGLRNQVNYKKISEYPYQDRVSNSGLQSRTITQACWVHVSTMHWTYEKLFLNTSNRQVLTQASVLLRTI
jgi:hypothetical protein